MKRLLAILIMLTVPFYENWIPSIIPPEWVDIQPIEWEIPDWPDEGASVNTEQLPAIEPDGLLGQRILNLSTGVEARFLTTSHDSKLNEETLKAVWAAVALAEEESGVTYAPEAHDTISGMGDRGCVPGSTTLPADELRRSATEPRRTASVIVACEVVAASRETVVQRIRTLTPETDQTLSLIADLGADTVVQPADLWFEEGRQLVWDTALRMLRQEAGGLSLMPPASPMNADLVDEILASTVPLSDGRVQVTIPATFTSSELQALGFTYPDAPVTVTLTDAPLSEVGEEFVARMSSGEPFVPERFALAGTRTIDCALLPCVALTFDDGPSGHTPLILDELWLRDVSASFFVLGDRVEDYPNVLVRAVTEGNLVLNHSWSHEDLTELDAEEIRTEINQTNTAIYEATGVVPNAFRPPYGEVNDEVLKEAKLPAILWDVDSEDWTDPGDEVVVSNVVTGAKPGSIVLMHDVHDTTTRSVGSIIEGLTDRGFTLVNLRQLFGEMPAEGTHNSRR